MSDDLKDFSLGQHVRRAIFSIGDTRSWQSVLSSGLYGFSNKPPTAAKWEDFPNVLNYHDRQQAANSLVLQFRIMRGARE